jgi:hypothetical protein
MRLVLLLENEKSKSPLLEKGGLDMPIHHEPCLDRLDLDDEDQQMVTKFGGEWQLERGCGIPASVEVWVTWLPNARSLATLAATAQYWERDIAASVLTMRP